MTSGLHHLEIDELNIHDRYTVAIKVNGYGSHVVGDTHREFSKVVFYFIRNGGRVTGEVCRRRQRSATHMIICSYLAIQSSLACSVYVSPRAMLIELRGK